MLTAVELQAFKARASDLEREAAVGNSSTLFETIVLLHDLLDSLISKAERP